MEFDNEGFLYPVVDKSQCVACGLCEKVCHRLHPLVCNNEPKAYAAYNLDDYVRSDSSSGGMFTLFAERILDKGGVVFGAAFDEELGVKHFCIDSKENLYKLRGSKYVQSMIGDAYKQAKEILETGRLLLFTGTPCQISGLLSYLGKDYEGLYTQDIICHGVPSVKMWKRYLNYLEVVHNSKVDTTKEPSFRSKTFGWLNFSIRVHFEKDTIQDEKHRNNLYMRTYLSDMLLRPSCYACDLKSLSRNSDITLADFWGVNKVMPEMFDDKGTSLILINTEKGKRLFDDISENCIFKETDIHTAIRYNAAAYTSPIRSFKRKTIIKNMEEWDFEALSLKCEEKNFFEKVCRKLRRVLKYKKL